jgi:hypothetical protein
MLDSHRIDCLEDRPASAELEGTRNRAPGVLLSLFGWIYRWAPVLSCWHN